MPFPLTSFQCCHNNIPHPILSSVHHLRSLTRSQRWYALALSIIEVESQRRHHHLRGATPFRHHRHAAAAAVAAPTETNIEGFLHVPACRCPQKETAGMGSLD